MKPKQNRFVVAPGGWADSIPDWMKKEVEADRMCLGMASLLKPLGPEQQVGDAEAACYLYTASLAHPISHRMGEVYIWLCAKLMKRRVKGELMDFMEAKLKTGLSADEERELKDLKRQIFRARGGEVYSPLIEALRSIKTGIGKGKQRQLHA